MLLMTDTIALRVNLAKRSLNIMLSNPVRIHPVQYPLPDLLRFHGSEFSAQKYISICRAMVHQIPA